VLGMRMQRAPYLTVAQEHAPAHLPLAAPLHLHSSLLYRGLRSEVERQLPRLLRSTVTT